MFDQKSKVSSSRAENLLNLAQKRSVCLTGRRGVKSYFAEFNLNCTYRWQVLPLANLSKKSEEWAAVAFF